MLTFVAAVYNEIDEIGTLIDHVASFVDAICIVDDGSTDWTAEYLDLYWLHGGFEYFSYITIKHTGLPETVKDKAVKMAPDGSWILMLDADERFEDGVLEKIREWVDSNPPENITHMYFTKNEYLDRYLVRSFQKVHLFRKESVTFSDLIHIDDIFTGDPVNIGLSVIHRKTSDKQRQREKEYLETYKKLLEEGKIDEKRFEWLRGLHYFER